MTKHVFHPSILRAYDIRGIVDETLTLNDAKAIGIAFAACLRQRGYGNHVAVGRDGRLSSPALAAALCDGLVAGGARVSDIGWAGRGLVILDAAPHRCFIMLVSPSTPTPPFK